MVWRLTEKDQQMMVTNLDMSQVLCSDSKQLKKWNPEIEQFVTSDITKTGDKSQVFTKKTAVYHLKHGYATVKNYDESTKMYVLKLKEQDAKESNKKISEQEEINAPANEVSQQIQVIVSSVVQSDQPASYGIFKININDRILEALQPLLSASGTPADDLFARSKLVSNDDTFLALSIPQDQKFLNPGGFGAVKSLEWKRFKCIQNESYTGMSATSPDALCFIARRDIYWVGFGQCQCYDKKDFTLEARWRVDNEEPSDWYTFEAPVDELPEDKLWRFNITTKGLKPVFVPKDSRIDIAYRCPEALRFCYIYSGYPDTYSRIEGQTHDFMTKYSDWNCNSTDSDWGFHPLILYYPADPSEEPEPYNGRNRDYYEEE